VNIDGTQAPPARRKQAQNEPLTLQDINVLIAPVVDQLQQIQQSLDRSDETQLAERIARLEAVLKAATAQRSNAGTPNPQPVIVANGITPGLLSLLLLMQAVSVAIAVGTVLHLWPPPPSPRSELQMSVLYRRLDALERRFAVRR
jgi:hypothetical protein